MKAIVIVCLVLNYQAYYFFPLPAQLLNVNSEGNKMLISGIICAAFVFLVAVKGTRRCSNFLKKYLLVFMVYTAAIFFYSVLHYGQSIISVFSVSYYYLILLLSCLLSYVFACDGGAEKFLKAVMYVTLAAMILLAVQAYLYDNQRIIFLKEYFKARDIRVRDGHLRMSITALGPFVAIYSGYLAIKQDRGKKRIWYTLIAAFGFYCASFVSRTRMLVVAVLAAISVMYYIDAKGKKRNFRLIVSLAVVLILISFTSFVGDFFESFSTDSELGSNTTIRFEAISYYLNAVLSYPLTGQGFINGAQSTGLLKVLRGPNMYFYYDDIGCIGTASRFGIWGFVFQIVLIYRFYKIIKISKKRGRHHSTVLLWGLLSYYVISMISLSMFDMVRLVVLAFMMAIFEYEYKACEQGTEMPKRICASQHRNYYERENFI